jgi:hypothetical protein
MHGLTGGSWKRSHDHRASFLPYSGFLVCEGDAVDHDE